MFIIIMQKSVSVYSNTHESNCSKYSVFDCLLLTTEASFLVLTVYCGISDKIFQVIGCYTPVHMSAFNMISQ